jgi:uncharacterized peroxidase-related enzyme
MVNVRPLSRDDLEAEFGDYLSVVERSMGFVPNSLFTLARRPEILRGFAAFAGAILGPGALPRELKQLIALMASTSAGCRYCQAHTSSTAARMAGDAARVEAVYEFETSDAFSEGERAALRLARDAGLVPNATTNEYFVDLRKHYDDGQVVEMMAVVGLFGFLNRWNDSMATELEEEPLAFASAHLADHGWEAGKHSS